MADVHESASARLLTPPGGGRSCSHLRGGGVRRRSRQADCRPPGSRPGAESRAGARETCGGCALAWRRGLMAAYAAWMVLLASAYFLLPGQRAVFWGLLALSGVFAIVAGVIIHRPAAPAAWLLLAAANLSFAIGQISFLVITEVRHESLTFPSPVDAFYLSTYPIYAAGLLIFIRRRGAGPRPARPAGRPHGDRQPGPAVLAVPDPALRAQSRAVLAAESGHDRLPDRGCAGPRHAGPVPGGGGLAHQVRPAPHPRLPGPAGFGRLVRASPAVQLVPSRGPRPTWAGWCCTPPGGPLRCTPA